MVAPFFYPPGSLCEPTPLLRGFYGHGSESDEVG